ncbi:MAG: regulatory protein RecX [Flavobacteriaceae bacterium]
MNTKTYTVTEAKRKLEQYCVYQDRCYQEVINKLKSMNMIPVVIDAIVTHLVEHNFLNEERFAKSFARGKFNVKHWGKQRITRELKARNISSYNIKSGLNEFSQDDYLTKLDTIALKKLDTILEPNKYKKRKKLADYLLYRGWESHLVYDKIKELIP